MRWLDRLARPAILQHRSFKRRKRLTFNECDDLREAVAEAVALLTGRVGCFDEDLKLVAVAWGLPLAEGFGDPVGRALVTALGGEYPQVDIAPSVGVATGDTPEQEDTGDRFDLGLKPVDGRPNRLVELGLWNPKHWAFVVV